MLTFVPTEVFFGGLGGLASTEGLLSALIGGSRRGRTLLMSTSNATPPAETTGFWAVTGKNPKINS
ncbi:hypothetical protein DPMN_067315 [Dreissena polymorpha]|uniref:Uncharacterized protein n=1 Tax=Dreissena polymorpha TaxID=45954 RepID=A0A9D4BL89_DREPO|nr:hypothetical protein DPMN_067315 [Dreissena polymorpha]